MQSIHVVTLPAVQFTGSYVTYLLVYIGHCYTCNLEICLIHTDIFDSISLSYIINMLIMNRCVDYNC